MVKNLFRTGIRTARKAESVPEPDLEWPEDLSRELEVTSLKSQFSQNTEILRFVEKITQITVKAGKYNKDNFEKVYNIKGTD